MAGILLPRATVSELKMFVGNHARRRAIVISAHNAAAGAITAEKAALTPAPYGAEVPQAEGCHMAQVKFDNKSDPKHTCITVEIQDFPGLLRTISWVMNGMGVRVKSADANTNEEGVAIDKFAVTDIRGRKLSDEDAASLADRIEDFVMFCSPLETSAAEEWECGQVRVSNLKHNKFTEVLVLGEPGNPGFLLELSSVLSGIGAIVHTATIRSDSDAGGTPDHIDYDFSQGRLFRFLVTDRQGKKLNASRVTSLIYTYDLVTGKGFMPTAAPNMDVYSRDGAL